MAKQINQYTKTRTSGTIKDDDLFDLDSTEDSGSTFESAKLKISELATYLSSAIPTFFSSDGAITETRNVEMNGFSAEFENGTVISKSNLNDVGFILQDSLAAEKGSLGYDVGLDSATLDLKDANGTFLNSSDGNTKLTSSSGTLLDADYTKDALGFGIPAQNGTKFLFFNSQARTNVFNFINSTNSSNFVFTDAGNFGIGTATPSELLEVDGNGLFSGTITQDATVSASYNNIDKSVNLNNRLRVGGIFTTDAPASGKGSISLDTTGTNRGRIIWSAGATLNGFLGVAEVAGGGVGDAAAGDSFWRTESKDLFFNTGSGITTSALTIKSGNGNVGIGTTTPTAKLNVQTSTSAGANNALLVSNNITDLFEIKDDGFVGVGGAAQSFTEKFGVLGLVKFSSGLGLFNAEPKSTTAINVPINKTVVSFNDSASYYQLSNELCVRAVNTDVINFLGTVAGTSLGGYQLAYLDGGTDNRFTLKSYLSNSTFTTRNTIYRSISSYYDGVSDNEKEAAYAHNITNPTTGDSQLDFSIGGSDIVSMLDSGNVGIGTATPTSKLEVVSNVDNSNLFRATDLEGVSGENIFSISKEGTGFTYYATIGRRQNSDAALHINRQTVRGTALGEQITFNAGGANWGIALDKFGSNSLDFFQDIAVSRQMAWGYGTTPVMTLDLDAGLGIGTATPTAKLNVETSTSAGANNALLVSNNITDLFTIKDDGEVSSKEGYWINNVLSFHKTGGSANTFVGGTTGLNASTNGNNAGFGFQSLRLLTSGSDNSSFGNYSLDKVTTGVWNTAMGSRILMALNGASQSGNTGVGTSTLTLLTSGNHNTGVGYNSLGNLLTGEGNIGIGKLAGDILSTGSFNTFLGTETKTDGDYSYSIALGYRAEVTGANQLVIGDSFGIINDVYLGRGVSTEVVNLGSVSINATSVDDGVTDGSAAASILKFAGARGTGTGTGGDIVFQTAPSGTTGSTQNALVTIMTLKDSGVLNIANIPTSATGLVAGDVYSNGGVLTIV